MATILPFKKPAPPTDDAPTTAIFQCPCGSVSFILKTWGCIVCSRCASKVEQLRTFSVDDPSDWDPAA